MIWPVTCCGALLGDVAAETATARQCTNVGGLAGGQVQLPVLSHQQAYRSELLIALGLVCGFQALALQSAVLLAAITLRR